MEKKQKRQIQLAFLLLIVLGVVLDVTGGAIKENRIFRPENQKGQEEKELILDADPLVHGYSYSLTLEEQQFTEEEAQKYMEIAKEEIDQSFYSKIEAETETAGETETADHVTLDVHPLEQYVEHKVKAEWYFDHYEIVSMEGEIQEANVPADGQLVLAEAELSCGKYKEWYSFYFHIYPKVLSQEEAFIQAISEDIANQQKCEGSDSIVLPAQINGISLLWKEKREYYTVKILLLEIVMFFLLKQMEIEKNKKEEQKRKQLLKQDYPEIVHKLTVLLGAGMSVKQAFGRIANGYVQNRQQNGIEKRAGYEEIVYMIRRMEDGESERSAYQKFAERTDAICYQRMVRILQQNREKGSNSLCTLLEQETQKAYIERKNDAKKLGEEASTKMLFPMILMLGIIMAIVMVPALLSL